MEPKYLPVSLVRKFFFLRSVSVCLWMFKPIIVLISKERQLSFKFMSTIFFYIFGHGHTCERTENACALSICPHAEVTKKIKRERRPSMPFV